MTPFVLPYPTIDPVLIELGPLAIRWYSLAYIAGTVIGWWYAVRLTANRQLWPAGTQPIKRIDLDDFVAWATLGIILGGRLGYVLFYDLPHFLASPFEILAIWQGGMSFHGGALGLALAAILFAIRRGIPVLSTLDVITAAAPIGLFFGRMANFINGELYGRATDVPWAMVFPAAGPEPRHPSQLYEAALEGVVLFLALRLATHSFGALKRPGLTLGLFLIGYGLARSFVELFRMPDPQLGFIYGGLTMGMLLSLPMVLVGAGLAFAALTRSRTRYPDGDDARRHAQKNSVDRT